LKHPFFHRTPLPFRFSPFLLLISEWIALTPIALTNFEILRPLHFQLTSSSPPHSLFTLLFPYVFVPHRLMSARRTFFFPKWIGSEVSTLGLGCCPADPARLRQIFCDFSFQFIYRPTSDGNVMVALRHQDDPRFSLCFVPFLWGNFLLLQESDPGSEGYFVPSWTVCESDVSPARGQIAVLPFPAEFPFSLPLPGFLRISSLFFCLDLFFGRDCPSFWRPVRFK